MMRRFVGKVVVAGAVSLLAVGLVGCGGDDDDSNGSGFSGGSVRIGNRTWMTENMNVETNDSWCYVGSAANCEEYGRLYTWNAAKSVCPSGWRLPTQADWEDLIEAVGGKNVAGTKLKAKTGWNAVSNPSNNYIPATDEFGFSALPGGQYYGSYFGEKGTNGFWWSATDGSEPTNARYLVTYHNQNDVYLGAKSKTYGMSVRCVRD